MKQVVIACFLTRRLRSVLGGKSNFGATLPVGAHWKV